LNVYRQGDQCAGRNARCSAEDAWIAATALEQGYLLVTHNARDFHGIPGLTTITERL
jgi:predicted nucleic acid-binding protein